MFNNSQGFFYELITNVCTFFLVFFFLSVKVQINVYDCFLLWNLHDHIKLHLKSNEADIKDLRLNRISNIDIRCFTQCLTYQKSDMKL
jgi:hypothetical protein